LISKVLPPKKSFIQKGIFNLLKKSIPAFDKMGDKGEK
jgi:hypothetical protein